MTIGELIEQLKIYPHDLRVLTVGYEGGFNDISIRTKDIVFNVNDKDAWYYGPHESVDFVPEDAGTKCLIIGRG